MSEAGETSTVAKGPPSSAASRPASATSSLEPVDLGDHQLQPRLGLDRPRNLDHPRKRLPVVAAARIVVADDISGRGGAQNVGGGERPLRVLRLQAEAERRDVPSGSRTRTEAAAATAVAPAETWPLDRHA